jgi:hypothetical protein
MISFLTINPFSGWLAWFNLTLHWLWGYYHFSNLPGLKDLVGFR